MTLTIHSNAIVRVDMYSYKYNFANKGAIATCKNIMAYILCISVVDHRDVTLDELVYLASEFSGDGAIGPGSGFEAYLEMLMRTWNQLSIVEKQTKEGMVRQAVEYPTRLAVRPAASVVSEGSA